MRESKMTIKDMAYIAIGIAVLIAGGFAILQFSMLFPIPGLKFIFMAPFLALVLYVLLHYIHSSYSMLYVGVVFGLLMGIFNLFMSLAIILTAIVAQVSILLLTKYRIKYSVGSVLFSTFTGINALVVSKHLIGGVFESISIGWIFLTGGLCTVFGVIGVLIGKKIIKYIPNRFQKVSF